MSIKSSIKTINKVSSIRVLFFSLIITKIECWPIFKQDPTTGPQDSMSHPCGDKKKRRFSKWNCVCLFFDDFDICLVAGVL